MKAVLFDFGGTIDTNGVHWSEKYWELYARFRVGVRKDEYEKSFVESERLMALDPEVRGLTFKQTLRKQITLQFKVLKLDGTNRLPGEMVDACYSEVAGTIDAAKEILRRLKEDYRLAVVSNFYGNLQIVCEEFGLHRLFDSLIDSTSVGVHKPDPAIFGLALEGLKVEGKDAFVVGDSYERDIVPSKQLGCTTIWLKGKSWTSPKSEESADFIISKFEDIVNIIRPTP